MVVLRQREMKKGTSFVFLFLFLLFIPKLLFLPFFLSGEPLLSFPLFEFRFKSRIVRERLGWFLLFLDKEGKRKKERSRRRLCGRKRTILHFLTSSFTSLFLLSQLNFQGQPRKSPTVIEKSPLAPFFCEINWEMTPEQVIEFLNQQRTQSASGVAHYYATFEDLYDRKYVFLLQSHLHCEISVKAFISISSLWRLWHQLTKKIEDFVREGNFSEGTELLQLYENFIVDFQLKINWLSLVQVSLAAARQFNGDSLLSSPLSLWFWDLNRMVFLLGCFALGWVHVQTRASQLPFCKRSLRWSSPRLSLTSWSWWKRLLTSCPFTTLCPPRRVRLLIFSSSSFLLSFLNPIQEYVFSFLYFQKPLRNLRSCWMPFQALSPLFTRAFIAWVPLLTKSAGTTLASTRTPCFISPVFPSTHSARRRSSRELMTLGSLPFLGRPFITLESWWESSSRPLISSRRAMLIFLSLW